MRGYSDADARTERDWEAKFRAIPEPDRARDYMQRLSARPHHVGSPYDKDNAEWMLSSSRSGDWTRTSKPSTCCSRRRRSAWSNCWSRRSSRPSCRSRPCAGDPTSDQHAEQLPTYNAYSADGDVTAPLVYVNYGVPGRLRAARAAGHFGEGRDRDRALRRSRGAASSPRWRPSTARSAASSIPTRATTATSRATCFPRARAAPRTACSAAA